MEGFSIPDAPFLRPLRADDAPELHTLVESNRAHLSPWLPWAAAQTLADTRSFLNGAATQLAARDGFQAALLREGAIVGVAGFHRVDWANRTTSIGYWLSEEMQGRGMMTVAVRLLASHAFGPWQLNRVEIRAAVENRRSRAIPERLGFVWEATLREAERVGDRYLDIALYAMLTREWADG